MLKKWKNILVTAAVVASVIGFGLIATGNTNPASADSDFSISGSVPFGGSTVTDSGSDAGIEVHINSCVDEDGDGYGWSEETKSTCHPDPFAFQGRRVRVVNRHTGETFRILPPSHYQCLDPDGDGWGWRESTKETCTDIDN